MSSAVVVRSEGDLDFKALAGALGKFRGVPFLDAIREAKNCMGLVAEDIPDEEARRIAAALREAGFDAKIAASIPPLPEVVRVLSLRFDASGLDALCPPQERIPIPLGEVSLIAAAFLPASSPRPAAAPDEKPGVSDRLQKMALNAVIPGAGMVLGAVKSAVRHETQGTGSAAAASPDEDLLLADLFLGEPLRRLRVDGNRLRYDFLGDKMAPNRMGNFTTFLRGLAVLAPNARRNRGFRVFIEGRPMREMGYTSLEDVERESRALLVS